MQTVLFVGLLLRVVLSHARWSEYFDRVFALLIFRVELKVNHILQVNFKVVVVLAIIFAVSGILESLLVSARCLRLTSFLHKISVAVRCRIISFSFLLAPFNRLVID